MFNLPTPTNPNMAYLTTSGADNLTCIQVNDISDANMINTLDMSPQQSFSLSCP